MNFNLTLIMQAVAFAAFIWFCARFVWPPLMNAIETRQKQIAATRRPHKDEATAMRKTLQFEKRLTGATPTPAAPAQAGVSPAVDGGTPAKEEKR